MSKHVVEVVPVALEKHPNADTLSIVRFHGYQVVVRTEDWQGRERGAYIPPDSIVPEDERFAFLGEHRRIRARRLRGVISMGLLMPAPDGVALGDDLQEHFGVTHCEPPMQCEGGEDTNAPSGYHPCFDVESARRYADSVFLPGEPLWVTEKIHGANGRFHFDGEAMHCGSRTTWKKQTESNLWWAALGSHPEIERFCRERPSITVYGEVYGRVQDLRYGVTGAPRIAIFDILDGATWLDPRAARDLAPDLPWVPLLNCELPYSWNALAAHAEGPSLMPGADHVREGVVARPQTERADLTIGRVHLKVVGAGYLERKESK